MDITLSIFLNYIFNFFALYVPETFLLTKPFKKANRLLFIFSLIITCFLNLHCHVPNFVCIFLSIFFVGLFSSPHILNMITALLGYIIGVCCNYFVLDMYCFFTGIAPTTLYVSTKHFLFFNLTFFLILCILLLTLKRIFGYWKNFDIYACKSIMISFLSFLIICVLIFVINFSYEQKLNFPKELTTANRKLFLLFFICTAVLLFFIVFTVEKNIKNQVALREMDNLQKYTEEIENMYSSIRSFKHDFANVMYSIKNYIDTDNMSDLKNYYYSNLIPQAQSLDISEPEIEQLTGIKIPELKSILYFKILQAKKYGISISLETNLIIDEIKIKPIDLTRIMGIFLDNAIEAVKNLPPDKKIIRTAFIKSSSEVTILIENPTSQSGIDLSEIYHKNVSTKGKDRGLGLHNVHTILNDYDNILLSTEYKDDTFLQILEIYT